MLVIQNAAQVVCVGRPGEHVKRGSALREPLLIADGSIIIRDGDIDWVGPTRELPPLPPDADLLDATGKIVLPGFVDSHTHLLFAGSREDEFERRLQGATYQQIAAAGGGINATVRSVRQASREQLRDLARPRLERLLQFGVTTVEVKSGYGLSIDDELPGAGSRQDRHSVEEGNRHGGLYAVFSKLSAKLAHRPVSRRADQASCRHRERSEAIQRCGCDGIASSLRSSQ